MLVMREAHVQNFGDTRFDPDNPGFKKHWWWDDSTLGISPGFSFFKHGEEVARAEVKPDQISGSYIGLKTPRSVELITYFEVHKNLRRRGLGREAILLLLREHPDDDMAAFSEDADDFWGHIGWDKFPHTSGRPREQRSVFMHWALDTRQ